MSDITLSLIYGIIAMAPIGLANAISKIPSKKIGVTSLMLIRNSLTSSLLFLILFYTKDSWNYDHKQTLFALLLSGVCYLAMHFYYKALEVGKVGIVSPVSSTFAVISIILSVIFFRTQINFTIGILIAMILIGTLLITLNIHEFRSSNLFSKKSGVPYALITAACWGLFFFFAQIPNAKLGVYFAAFLFEFGMLVCTVAHLFIQKTKLIIPNKTTFLQISAIAILTVISALALYKGIKETNAAVVLALSAATPVVISLYGRFVYKEKLSALQYLAVSAIILSIAMLSLVK